MSVREYRSRSLRFASLVRALLVTGLAFALLGTASASAKQTRPTADKVVLQLSWVPKEEYAFIYAGRELGFYRRQGIDLKLNSSLGVTVSAVALNSGKADFGYFGGPDFINAVSAGMKLKMISLFQQRTPLMFLSWPDTPVRSAKDFEGKRILFIPGADGVQVLWSYLVEQNGIDDSKVQKINTSFAGRNAAFVSHQGDVMPWFVTASSLPLERTAKTAFVKLPGYKIKGLSIPQNGLVARDETIRSNPDLVRRMNAATIASYNWMQAHPRAASRIMTTYLAGVDVGTVTQAVRASLPLLHTSATKGKPTGWMAHSDWQQAVNIMRGAELLKGSVTAKQLYTNQFLPAARK